ncbi:HD domain-containing protein [Streptomyces sp. NPDC059991]|uniref:HD domain-containing protein n=1 Tax=Streptomyces sp. NPDC059991 TaxID=3347028 RepID=UPI0036903A0A
MVLRMNPARSRIRRRANDSFAGDIFRPALVCPSGSLRRSRYPRMSLQPYPLRVMAVGWACELAEVLLSESLPRRWAHTQGVVACASNFVPLLEDRAEALEAAAVLHDIGYALPLVVTGFHPLDGARHLRTLTTVDERVVRLVANHSFALLEAEERGLDTELADEFPLRDGWCSTVHSRIAHAISFVCPVCFPVA